MEKLIKRLIVCALAAGASGTVFLIATLAWHSSQSQSSTTATIVAEPVPAGKTPEGKRETADGEGRGTMPETNWEGAKQWGVKSFGWPIGILTVLVAVLTGILLYRREMLTLKGFGTIFFVVVIVSLLAIFGHKTYKWWLSRPVTIPSVTQAEPVPTTLGTTSRVTTRTIIARPDEWSEMISIPAHHNFRLLPEGKITVKTASGRQWKDWPGKNHDAGRDLKLHDAMFQFRSLEIETLPVTVEWEPK